MKPFQLPAWRKRQIRNKTRRENKVIARAVSEMEEVLLKAAEAVIDQYTGTDHFPEPSLSEMFSVSERFYRSVLEASFESCEEEKAAQKNKKKLQKLPFGMPKRLPNLEKVFRDRRFWPKIMKRSRLLTERLRKQYLLKLQKTFRTIIPQLRDGHITTHEAKAELKQAWKTSKSRVELIFRTETTTYFGKAQVAFYGGDSEIIGFMFDSVRDTSRTPICKSRHGLIYRPGTPLLDENTPALHYNCRSHLIALANTEFNRKLLKDPSRDPAKVKVVALKPGWRN